MANNLTASYDKVVLGVALVIALALGAMVYLNAGKLDKDFQPESGIRGGPPANPNEAEFKKQTGKVGTPITLEAPVDDERVINNFVGTSLFLKKNTDEPVDLGDGTNEPVHPPIPNQWWLDHRIDPGYDDSPQRDPDGDGFSNLDEFQANTNPNNSTDHPTLIAKLKCAKLDKKPFLLIYTSDNVLGQIKPGDKFKFRYQDVVKGRQRNINSPFIEAGKGGQSTFFAEGPAQLRFELKEVVQRQEVNKRNGLQETNTYALVEDVSPTKKGEKHEIKKGSRNGKIIRDFTAHLYLDAIGEENNVVAVPERSSFALPFDDNAAEKPFTFAGVNEAGEVIIEWDDAGTTKTMPLVPEAASK